MALIRTKHEHQTAKPATVSRDGDNITIAWGAVSITIPTDEAAALAGTLTSVTR